LQPSAADDRLVRSSAEREEAMSSNALNITHNRTGKQRDLPIEKRQDQSARPAPDKK
jgi:hypothetical protein